jgi:hypothetical protein
VAEKPKALPKPAPTEDEITMADLGGDIEDVTPKPAPAPVAEKPKAAAKPVAKAAPAPAAKASSDDMASLLGDLDDLLGSTDD